MKIDQITIQNLASIEGRHTINFNAEPLRSAGLFAITGSTGAGKSTLLDAICLALYGTAPRFELHERLTRGGKDDLMPYDPRNILRRGAREALAQVTFTAPDGASYRASWAVRLRRTGTCTPAERTLQRLSPEPENIDPRSISATIERILGLDFTQFTRTVILAQNSFANFLRARQDEKSRLLEKITGTEIYARLGKEIFRLAREAGQSYTLLATKLQGMSENLLDETDLKKAQEEKTLLSSRLIGARENAARTEARLQWYTLYAQATATLRERTAQAALVRKEQLAFEEQRRRVERHDLVVSFQPLYKEIKLTEQSLADNKEQLSLLLRRIDTATSQQRTATATADECRAHLNEVKQQLARRAPQIKQGYEIQGEMRRTHEELQKKTDDIRLAQNRLESQRAALAEKQQEHARSKARIDECEHRLQQYAVHRNMLEKTDMLSEKLSRMLDLTDELKKLRQSQQRDQSERAQLALTTARIEKQSQEIRQEADALQSELTTHREANYGTDGDELQNRLLRLAEHTELLQGAQTLWTRLADGYNRIEETDDELSRLSAQLRHEEQTLERAEGAVEALAEEFKNRQTAYTLSSSENIVRLRRQLKEGTPCPVCGATHHPYHTETQQELGNLLSNLENLYNAARKRLDESTARRDSLRAGLAALRATLQARKELAADLQNRQKAGEQEWTKYAALDPTFAQCTPSINRDGRRIMIEQLLENAAKDLEHTRRRWADYSLHQKHINRCTALIEKQQLLLQENSGQKNHALAAAAVTDTRLEQTAQRMTHVNDLLQQLYEELDRLVTLQSWWTVWNENPEAFRQKLMNMKAYFDSVTQRLLTERQNELTLQHKQQTAATQLQEVTQYLLQANDEKVRINESIKNLESRLAELFGSRRPKDVADELDRNIQEAENLARQAAERLEAINSSLLLASGQRNNLETQRQALLNRLSTLRSSLDERILDFNRQNPPLQYSELERIFSEPTDWNALRHHAEELSNRALLARERADAAEQQVCTLQASENRPGNGPDETQPALAEALERAKSLLEELQLRLADADHRLRLHQETKAKTQALATELESLRTRRDNWAALSTLLGDSEGKKFRSQAQNFTFEFLVRDANEQLARLTPRYRLSHQKGTLQLEIVDRDMYDEHRPVNSLSGGETFIVSLALALALAALSSSGQSTGCLFIDEGFGNLDAESLEMVMNALSSLQDTQGRKVGVISHTDQIRLRIRPQIHIVKLPSGGKSTISVES